MIFRDSNGELIEINRYHFKNDKLYYSKIMDIKKQFTKSDKQKNVNSNINQNIIDKLFEHS